MIPLPINLLSFLLARRGEVSSVPPAPSSASEEYIIYNAVRAPKYITLLTKKVLDSDVQICYNKAIKEQEIQINGYYH